MQNSNNVGRYRECARYLRKANDTGENIDELTKIVWHRQNIEGKLELAYLEMFITTKCNLNCLGCSNLIASCKSQEHIDKQAIFSAIDNLLNKIDRLYRLKLHGGEVLLHPDLVEIIDYVGSKDKIVSLRLTTNGTIIPSEKVLNIIKKRNLVVQISDYKLPNLKTEQLIQALKTKGIRYTMPYDAAWRDMGGFEKREYCRRQECTIGKCNSMLDGKIFICSRAAMMDKLGIAKSDSLSVYEDVDFRQRLVGLLNIKDYKACWHCNGNTKHAKSIPIAEQFMEPLEVDKWSI